MNNTTVITYKKNKQEKTIKKFIEYNLKKEIATIKKSSKEKNTVYNLKDIEYIHIKNYEFDDNDCNFIRTTFKNEVLILENCIFNTKSLKIIGSKDNYNNLKIINPIFKKECEVLIKNIKNVDIFLSEEGENIELNITNCSDVYLDCSSKLKKLNNYRSFKTYIKNLDTNKEIYIFSLELLLENSNIEKIDLVNYKTHLINSAIKSVEDLIINNLYELVLENGSSITAKSILLPILKKIKYEDSNEDKISYLEASEHIAISNPPYHIKAENESIILNKENTPSDLQEISKSK